MKSDVVHWPLEAENWPKKRNWQRLDDVTLGVWDCPHSTPKITEHGPYVVRSQDIRSGVFRYGDAARVSEETYKERIERAEPSPGDILYSREGTYFGIAAEMPNDKKVCLGQRMVLIRPDPERLNSRFLRLWLNSPVLSRHIHGFRDGTVAERLNMPTIRGLPIPEFDRTEQDAIAELLGSLDDKIELNRRMNETLEEMARALFRDWFVDFGPTRRQIEGATDPAAIMGHAFPAGDMPAEVGTDTASDISTTNPLTAATLAPLFPAKLGDDGLPEGWANCSIYDVAKVVYGAPFKSKQFNTEGRGRPLARIRDLPKNVAGQFTEEIHKKEHLIQPGDIVVGMDGEFRSYLWYGVPTLMNQRVCSFVPLARSNRAFVWLAIKPLLNFFEDTAIATTVIHLGKGDIDTFSVVDPGEDILAVFAKVAGPMASKIVANGQENQTLAEMRDLLLPKLMSGEIRLKDAQHQMEAIA